jgi:hypothetical protein
MYLEGGGGISLFVCQKLLVMALKCQKTAENNQILTSFPKPKYLPVCCCQTCVRHGLYCPTHSTMGITSTPATPTASFKKACHHVQELRGGDQGE